MYRLTMKHIILTAAAIMLTLVACSDDDNASEGQQVVVEGWIEDGEFPIVKLSSTIPITDKYQSLDSLGRYILRWQRVTISDGSQTVTLNGKIDERYFPPYIYTTTDMRGQTGRTYRLTIHRTDMPDITAETTIPESVPVDSFSMESFNGSPTRRSIYAHTTISPYPVTYYKMFTRQKDDSQDYLSSFLGVMRSDMIPADGRISIQPGRTNFEKNYIPYYNVGDTVFVRFARIDSVSYEYWRSFEDMLSLSRNSLFPITKNMPSTIPDALGYWQGFGSKYYRVIVE